MIRRSNEQFTDWTESELLAMDSVRHLMCNYRTLYVVFEPFRHWKYSDEQTRNVLYPRGTEFNQRIKEL